MTCRSTTRKQWVILGAGSWFFLTVVDKRRGREVDCVIDMQLWKIRPHIWQNNSLSKVGTSLLFPGLSVSPENTTPQRGLAYPREAPWAMYWVYKKPRTDVTHLQGTTTSYQNVGRNSGMQLYEDSDHSTYVHCFSFSASEPFPTQNRGSKKICEINKLKQTWIYFIELQKCGIKC